MHITAARCGVNPCVHAYTCAYILCDAGHDVTSHIICTLNIVYSTTTVASAGARLELYRSRGHSIVHSHDVVQCSTGSVTKTCELRDLRTFLNLSGHLRNVLRG